jgi:CheY-like chemotaxis protein
MAKKILSLGQCSADSWSIERLFTTQFHAEVLAAHSQREALELLQKNQIDLVLVNRLLDRDGSSGLDFILRLKKDEALRQLPVMLVSNYEDAQRQAVERGALPGFGKAALAEPETLERLRVVLEKCA